MDNARNNGMGNKAAKEESGREHDKPAARMSLKSRLAEKKAQVAGYGKEENIKNKQREM